MDYSTMCEPVKSWDEYFYELCKTVGRHSKCLSRQIGAVLVRDKSVVSTGYNGPPRSVPTCDKRWYVDGLMMSEFAQKFGTLGGRHHLVENKCPRQVLQYKSGQGLEWCVAGHAERNSLINAARLGISTKGTTLFMDCGVPCSPCLVEIINAGVDEIVVTKVEYYDVSAEYLLKNSTLKCRTYDFLK